MRSVLIAAFVASSLFTGPGLLVSSGAALAQSACGPDAPEAWLRPGGYCDSIGAGRSLSVPVEPGCSPRILKEIEVGAKVFQKGDRVIVAEICVEENPCPVPAVNTTTMKAGDRLRVADSVLKDNLRC